jgi:hypothetical protein
VIDIDAIERAPAATREHRLKRFLPVRALLALRRRYRKPLQGARAARAERADRRAGRIPPPPRRRRDVRSIVWFPVGPGQPHSLLDSIEALGASDRDGTAILVTDDCSVDSRESVIRERFPEVEVVRTPAPTGGPPHMWPICRLALEHALEHYDFGLWVKMDADALVTGPRFSETILDRLDPEPDAGIAGSFLRRADGRPEDHVLHAEVIARERPRDSMLDAAVRRAEARGWRTGDIVQGGICCLTRAGVEAIDREGYLKWRSPWHSTASEDMALTVFVLAAGLRAVPIGGPGELLAIGNFRVPIPKKEAADGPCVGVHSVRRGRDGESEAELRAYFRARRTEWAS